MLNLADLSKTICSYYDVTLPKRKLYPDKDFLSNQCIDFKTTHCNKNKKIKFDDSKEQGDVNELFNVSQ